MRMDVCAKDSSPVRSPSYHLSLVVSCYAFSLSLMRWGLHLFPPENLTSTVSECEFYWWFSCWSINKTQQCVVVNSIMCLISPVESGSDENYSHWGLQVITCDRNIIWNSTARLACQGAPSAFPSNRCCISWPFPHLLGVAASFFTQRPSWPTMTPAALQRYLCQFMTLD